MYPNGELKRLAAHKAAVRREIALHRSECAAAVARLARPVAWLDRVLAFWRRLSPLTKLATIPLGLLAKRRLFPRLGTFGTLVRWGPLIFGAARQLGAMLKSAPGPVGHTNGRSSRVFARF